MFAVPPAKFGAFGCGPAAGTAGKGPPESGEPGLVEVSMMMVWLMV
ncbi:hypothetical protein JJE66_05870 [Bradyrhizobium diazoefficiens]|nr:hypothetical protein [Bradyrhizobium diazoefficiens]MBK3660780.1 hypothetical protein [Bradyrhizobium diazoefficiens]